jgi:predicted O-methyltransferase YrrM
MTTGITFLDELFRTGIIVDKHGKKNNFHSGINPAEAEKLIEVIKIYEPKKTLEIGLAMGSSSICFLHTKKSYCTSGKHYAVDPNQFSDYNGLGLHLIHENDLAKDFILLEGRTHEVFHKLLEEKNEFDMAFIDGWHTFDYTLIDFFFIDKVLKDGGIIAFHDMYGLAKIKVLKYILSHRDYRIMYENIISEKNKAKVFKFFVWRIIKNPSLILSKYFWQFQIKSHYGLIFIQKNSAYEPKFDFYKNF